MREIKFRAWDKYEEKMSYDVSIYSDKNGSWWSGDHIDEDSGDTITSFDKGELMQFTGLKDKNGKGIFSGDLIRQHGTLYEIRPCVGGFECQIWKEYKQGGAEEGSIYMFSCLLDTACEIIGNLYENPELLK